MSQSAEAPTLTAEGGGGALSLGPLPRPARAELIRSLGVFCEVPGAGHLQVSEALGLDSPPTPSEHTDLFVLHLPPFAAVYLGPEGMLGGSAGDRVAGFWRALGLAVPAEPDHLASLLGLYAALMDFEAGERNSWGDPGASLRGIEASRRARASLAWEHLLCWAPAYATKAGELAGGFSPAYRVWAELVMEALLAEAAELGPPGVLPLHLREAAALADPAEGGQAFLSALLAPARTGMLLTRTDLARAGADLSLGVRIGERRFTLASLLGQDARAVLGWLAGEAAWWSEWAEDLTPVLGSVGVWWARRAASTRDLLLAASASADTAQAASAQSGER